MKVYNVVVNGMENGISVYSEVRSFKTFKGAEECLHKEYDYIKAQIFNCALDIDDYNIEEANNVGWFEIDFYGDDLFYAGSIFVCEIED